MFVIFQFLGMEPIENVVSCTNFEIDKVVYFGYRNVIKARSASTERFLSDHCGVKKVEFIEASEYDLSAVHKSMRDKIQREIGGGNDIFFDVTNAEGPVMMAFGRLSEAFDIPVHKYDIETNTLFTVSGEGKKIEDVVPKRRVNLNLDMYVELFGGCIKDSMSKDYKVEDDPAFDEDIDSLWNIEKNFIELWNPFSDFIRKNFVPDDALHVFRKEEVIKGRLRDSVTKLDTVEELDSILDALASKGILTGKIHADGEYNFSFKNEKIKDMLWESGSVLELYTFRKENPSSDDCRVGVFLDWDGVIQPQTDDDVINEIDIMALKGNVPVFISCKSGKMDTKTALYSLYELQAVAQKFGGKYAKKILVTVQPIPNSNFIRAHEMGIEVRELGKRDSQL